MCNNYTEVFNNKSIKECQTGSRCGLFKTCEACNRQRQARICDIVELANRFSNRATYAVVMPFNRAQNQETIKRLKTNLTRKLRKSTDGMMVSVETSAADALHLNLILNHQEPITPIPFQIVSKNMGIDCDIFVEEIDKNQIRRVSAYALKRQSIPTKDQYDGNTANLSGNLRTMKEILQSKRMINHNPLVAITSMCNTLVALGLEPPTETLLETPRLQRSLNNLIYLSEQVKSVGLCYSEKRGLLTAKEFKIIYKRKLRQCKSDLKRKKLNMSFDERWRKLPKGISLKEHLESNKG